MSIAISGNKLVVVTVVSSPARNYALLTAVCEVRSDDNCNFGMQSVQVCQCG